MRCLSDRVGCNSNHRKSHKLLYVALTILSDVLLVDLRLRRVSRKQLVSYRSQCENPVRNNPLMSLPSIPTPELLTATPGNGSILPHRLVSLSSFVSAPSSVSATPVLNDTQSRLTPFVSYIDLLAPSLWGHPETDLSNRNSDEPTPSFLSYGTFSGDMRAGNVGPPETA